MLSAEWLDIIEVGELLGLIKPIPGDANPRRTFLNQRARVYRLRKLGLPLVKLNGQYRISRADLNDWLSRIRSRDLWPTQEPTAPPPRSSPSGAPTSQ